MEFKARELKFGFQEKERFDAEAVKQALKAQGFAGAELLSGPS
jgi:hypothetical protein